MAVSSIFAALAGVRALELSYAALAEGDNVTIAVAVRVRRSSPDRHMRLVPPGRTRHDRRKGYHPPSRRRVSPATAHPSRPCPFLPVDPHPPPSTHRCAPPTGPRTED